jgi:flagellar biosynthesis GTPase FlhF
LTSITTFIARLFVDGYLTDVLRNMSNDPTIEQKVKKKLMRVLAAWHVQYKDDPSMKTVANLYKHSKSDANAVRRPEPQSPKEDEVEAAKRKSKEEAQRKAGEEAERLKKEKKKKREGAGKSKTKRKPFNFEEVPYCLSNAILRKLTESVIPGETKDPYADRECDPIREQPRQRYHCGFFLCVILPWSILTIPCSS